MELLLRIIDKPHSGKPELDARRTMAGDVIAVAPDGHIWGKQEVLNPEWRIVRVPGMGRDEAQSLVTVEKPRAFGGVRLLRKRDKQIDVVQLDIAENGALLTDRSAKRTSVDVVVSRANLRACLSLKPALIDPRIVGPRRGVVG